MWKNCSMLKIQIPLFYYLFWNNVMKCLAAYIRRWRCCTNNLINQTFWCSNKQKKIENSDYQYTLKISSNFVTSHCYYVFKLAKLVRSSKQCLNLCNYVTWSMICPLLKPFIHLQKSYVHRIQHYLIYYTPLHLSIWNYAIIVRVFEFI